MTIRLRLSSEAEAQLRDEAAAAGVGIEDYLMDALEEKLSASTRARSSDNGTDTSSKKKRLDALLKWAESHSPLPYEVDDSRESIYEGRGE